MIHRYHCSQTGIWGDARAAPRVCHLSHDHRVAIPSQTTSTCAHPPQTYPKVGRDSNLAAQHRDGCSCRGNVGSWWRGAANLWLLFVLRKPRWAHRWWQRVGVHFPAVQTTRCMRLFIYMYIMRCCPSAGGGEDNEVCISVQICASSSSAGANSEMNTLVYVCMYRYECMYKYEYIYTYIYIYVCMYVRMYSCIHINTCQYIFTRIYIYIYILIFMCLGTHIHMYMYINMGIHVWMYANKVYIPVHICAYSYYDAALSEMFTPAYNCIYTYACADVYICLQTYVCMCIYTYMYTQIYIHINIYISIKIYIYMYIYIHIFIYIYKYAHM